MGNLESRSKERLDIPLHAQSPPLLATANGSIITQFTSLCVQRKGGWSSTLEVIDAATQRHVFYFKYPSFSSRCILQTPDERPLLMLKHKTFSSRYCVYEGDQRERVSLEIRLESHVIFADVRDRLSGRTYRILIHGETYDRVAMFYLEHGQPGLPLKPSRKDIENFPHRFQAIGRIRRPHGKAFSQQQHYIEGAPGVDMTLLLLLWRVWQDREDARQSSDSSTTTSSDSVAISTD